MNNIRRSSLVPLALSGVLGTAGLILGFLLIAREARALEKRADVARSVQEIRLCGNLEPQQSWSGTRWVCDGLEVAKATIRRVGELIAGTDVTQTNTNRSQENLAKSWGFEKEDADFLKRTFYANFYFPLSLSSSSSPQGGSGAVGGASSLEGGRVLATTSGAGSGSQEIQSWNNFLQNTAPTTKTPRGKATLLGLAALDRQAQLEQAIHELTPTGGPFPQFQGEQGQTGAGSQSGQQTVTDQVIVAAWEQRRKGELFVDIARDAIVHGTDTGAPPVESPNTAMRPVQLEKPNSSTQTVSHPGAGSEATGIAAARVTGQSGGLSGLDPLACRSCGNPAAGIGGMNGFLGGSPFAQAFSRFGFGGLGNLASLFDPSQFSNLLTNRFPPGGGGGGPPPTTQTSAPIAPCDARQPQLSSTEAQQVADLLGLPITSAPWITQYRPIASVIGTRGVQPASGQSTTITSSDFAPNEECLWVVTANSPDGTQDVVLASDRRDTLGTRILLAPL